MKLRLNYKGWCQRYVTCFCKDCNFLGSSKSYDDHLVEYHDLPKSSRKNKSRKVSNKETIYQCGKCDAEYTTRVSLKQHIAIKHLETVYSCDICDTSHKKVLDIKEHMSLMHPKDNHLITTYCGECQTESANDLAYRHIMKMHRSCYTKNYR